MLTRAMHQSLNIATSFADDGSFSEYRVGGTAFMTVQPGFGQQPAGMFIPHTATIEGFLDYDGDIVVEGTVIGNVRCRSLTVKERGQVDGNAVAERIVILGDVTGAIYANDLVLRTACSVAGDIFHKQLRLEDGCYFEGKSRRHANPMSLATQ